MNRDPFMVRNLPKKKVVNAHNSWARLFTGLLCTRAITYFSVGKNRRKKAFPTDIYLTISLYRSR